MSEASCGCVNSAFSASNGSRRKDGGQCVYGMAGLFEGRGPIINRSAIRFFSHAFVEMGAPTRPNGFDLDPIDVYVQLRDAGLLTKANASRISPKIARARFINSKREDKISDGFHSVAVDMSRPGDTRRAHSARFRTSSDGSAPRTGAGGRSAVREARAKQLEIRIRDLIVATAVQDQHRRREPPSRGDGIAEIHVGPPRQWRAEERRADIAGTRRADAGKVRAKRSSSWPDGERPSRSSNCDSMTSTRGRAAGQSSPAPTRRRFPAAMRGASIAPRLWPTTTIFEVGYFLLEPQPPQRRGDVVEHLVLDGRRRQGREIAGQNAVRLS